MTMQIMAWVAAGLVFCTFFMKTMIPLRFVAIVSNVAFILYGLLGFRYEIFSKVLPILVLHVALLPLNVVRLYQMKSLISRVNAASNTTTLDHLIPYMKEERHQQGEVLFEKDDKADRLYYLVEGRVRLPEVDDTVGSGSTFGEVGLFATDSIRAASAICDTDCHLYTITRDKVLELYYQNPEFGFFLIRLVSDIVHRHAR